MKQQQLEEKYKKYFELTTKALAKIKIGKPKNIDWKYTAEEFLDMAKRYYSDAIHFEKKGDLLTAYAAVTYAHGWLDAGARLGLFDVHDNELFVVD